MKKYRMSYILLGLILSLLAMLPGNAYVIAQVPDAESGPVATLLLTEDSVSWKPQIEGAGYVLTIAGPEDFYMQHTYQPGAALVFWAKNDAGTPRANGVYQYELYALPLETPLDVDDALRGLEPTASSPKQSGHFAIFDASVVVSPIEEESGEVKPGDGGDNGILDQVIIDDLIVQQSACIGMDCVNGESFGFDTLRLKENNLRIHFQDTSSSASFPTNDWRIVINDSSNGGKNYFAVEDSNTARQVFKVEAGAPANALYVEADGDVGLGTSEPVVKLEVADGDTPTVRLNQDGSAGWAAQTWDVAGNEAGFFIRDATNGSKLAFRIQPNTPADTLTLRADGNVGLGTWSPNAALDIRNSGTGSKLRISSDGTDANTQLIVNGTGNVGIGTGLPEGILHMSLAGSNPAIVFERTDGHATRWEILNANNGLRISANGTNVFRLDTAGNLTIPGAMSDSSDASLKENFDELDSQAVLATVADLKIASWNYIADDPSVRHIGPTAQEFYKAFGLGADDKHIASLDTAGVALAAIQGLNELVDEKDARISALEAQNTELEARLTTLEQTVGVHSTVGLSFFVLLPWFLSGMLFLAIAGMLAFKLYTNIKKQ